MSHLQTPFASSRWFDLVPNGWAIERLKRVTSSISSGVSVNASNGVAEDQQLGVLKTSAVTGGKFFPEENKTVWETETDRLGCPVTRDTVIMSRMNTPSLVGESGYVPDDFPTLFLPDRLWKLTFDSKRVFTPYISNVLSSSGAREALSSMATGTSPSMKNLSIEEMGNLPIPLPSLEEQKAISAYLQLETARIDGLIAEKERMLALLEEKRAALISRVVTRGLDPGRPLKPSNAPWFDKTPTTWSVEKLKWIIKSVSSGVSVNASDQPVEEEGFGVLKTSAVAGGTFIPAENKSIWDAEHDRLACPVTKNTIIMSRMNTPNLVGESGYVAKDYPNLFLPDRLWQISFDEGRVFVPFMALLLASKEARHALSAMATGTSPSMKNLAIEEMASLLVPVPTLEEQQSIYDEVARRDATIGPLMNELVTSVLLLKERRAALITAAVTGQIPSSELQNLTKEPSCASIV